MPPNAADYKEWQLFKARFLAPEGRVVDVGNGGISHSEGQGYGMLLAVANDDRAAFEHLLGWTLATLARPDDSLLSWRYDPNRAVPVDDPNTATDGDLFIAWALWRASWRWSQPRYAALARAMAQDVLLLETADSAAGAILLPGVAGFQKGAGTDVNLSYYCLPAMRELSQAAPSPRWAQLRASGLDLLTRGRFGAWSLPPDWLRVFPDNSLAPSPDWPARFSYDAIRIPLYLAWDGQYSAPIMSSFLNYCSKMDPNLPAWVDLETGNGSSYAASGGVRAVADLACAGNDRLHPTEVPSIRSSPDYFSSALSLLSRLASAESAVFA